VQHVTDALATAFDMFWQVLWPLVLGFCLSAIVQAVVSHESMSKTLGDALRRRIQFLLVCSCRTRQVDFPQRGELYFRDGL
jgi:hypothetical protein